MTEQLTIVTDRSSGSPRRSAEALLAVVVIARNEERHIGQCLEAIARALTELSNTRVILVDSSSTDRTVDIASRYTVEIYRYTGPPFSAAAGRCLGFERTHSRYVLFVDGDCCIEAHWVKRALRRIVRDRRAGVVFGGRREVYEDDMGSTARAAPSPEEYGLGGNALYRAKVLREAGGFNPFLRSDEEGELLGRILALGYHSVTTPDIMFTHHTLAKSSPIGFVTRLRRGLGNGIGQTLRVAIGQGLFLYHARRLNRYLLMLGYVFVGIAAGLIELLLARPGALVAWLFCGVVIFLLLSYRRRSVGSATYIMLDWFFIAIHLPFNFSRRPERLESFSPLVERLK